MQPVDTTPLAGTVSHTLSILDLVAQYHDVKFARRDFQPGESPVPVAGRVFDAAEIVELVDSSLDFWLTAGRFADQFERLVHTLELVDFASRLERVEPVESFAKSLGHRVTNFSGRPSEAKASNSVYHR